MSTTFRHPILAGVLAFVLCSVAQQVRAFAIFTVGAGCPYGTIQAAVDAAAATPGEDYVWIANNAIYSGQHIVIDDADGVDIEGGFSDCNDFDIGPNDYTTISGANNDGGPVFEISGTSHVYLGNLVITGARRTGFTQYGGGVSFIGAGALVLGNTTVSNNHAYVGGGVYLQPAGGAASLTLLSNTLVIFNYAQAGGGVAVIGGQAGSANSYYARFTADADQILIGYNHATGPGSGVGGGLFVEHLATAHLGSPGYNGLGTIFDNDAIKGGGVAVSMPYPASVAGAALTLSGSRIQSNSASVAGGAVYVSHGTAANSGNYPQVYFNAQGFRLDDNIAPEGAAIFTETDPPAPNANYHGVTHVSLTNASGGSNSIDGNGALDALGNPTGGSTILFQTDGELQVAGVRLRNNTAAHILRTLSPETYDGTVSVDSVLVADNTISADVFSFEGNAYTGTCNLYSTTITHNTLGEGNVYSECRLSLYYDIIDQPGTPALAYVGPQYGLSAAFILASDPATVPANAIVPGMPVYADATHGDYHLAAASPGIDVAFSDFVHYAYDLDGNPRVKDLASIPDAQAGNGQDIGAYEMQYVCAQDEVFCGGFEH